MNTPNLNSNIIKVIIPAYNEEDSIGLVIRDIPDSVHEIIVVNNNSTDATAKNAKDAGATVLSEPKPGYGNACLKGIDYLITSKNRDQISSCFWMEITAITPKNLAKL